MLDNQLIPLIQSTLSSLTHSNETLSGTQSEDVPPIPIVPASDVLAVWPFIAGISAWFALFISILEVGLHLANYTKPYLQKYIIRILWMVPIYAFNAWIGMKFPHSAIYLDTLRECYEAFVIYSFMKYLMNFLYRETDSDLLIQCKPPQKHLFPLCWLHPMAGGHKFLNTVKQGILQYTVIRPITTIVALLSQLTGVYGEGSWSPSYSYIYLFIVNNLSQMIAMYCLVIFYHAYRVELSPMSPLGKFLSIKCVIFFSFFQSVLIAVLIEFGIITRAFTVKSTADAVDIQRNLQDFLICLEMMIAAFAHVFVFSHRPYINQSDANDSSAIINSFWRVIDMTDERTDITDHFRQVYYKGRDTVLGRRRSSFDSDPSECSALIAMQPTDRSRLIPSSSHPERTTNPFYSTC